MAPLTGRVPILGVVALLSILCVAPADAAPPGYFVDSKQAAAKRPVDQVKADGDFTYSLHRRFDDATGARLLAIAEAAYPPRSHLVDIAIDRGFEVGSDSAHVPLWWCNGLGVARVPYAITAGALEHYMKLTDRFRRHIFREMGSQGLYWTNLTYRATIVPRDRYTIDGEDATGVYVAEMNLSWSYDDGTFIQVSVAHRVVVLARDGEVLAVEGDGDTREEVFMSSHSGKSMR
jgi:hypothetical protein